jgi:phasin protein
MTNRKTELNQPVNNEWMPKGTEAWWATATEHQSEMLDFMSHRLSKDSQAVRQLGECRSWEDASGIYSRWLQETFKDYSAEATKVMAMNVKQAADIAQDRRPRH